MTRTPQGSLIELLELEDTGNEPLYGRLFLAIRNAIVNGALTAGARLPSTRTLAGDLQLSRNTVAAAFDQLRDEGFVESRIGSGTYVTDDLPPGFESWDSAPRARISTGPRAARRVSVRAKQTQALPWGRTGQSVRPFAPGLPALDRFPNGEWNAVCRNRLRRHGRAHLGYADPAGYEPLRVAIASHVALARGVRCSPDQVVITSSAQHALDLLARVLIDPGDSVWIEEPGNVGARAALTGAGARLHAIPVDGHGVRVDVGVDRHADARLAYVTPTHQFPLGFQLSDARRLALLDWASESGAWIVEDDHDGEFRHCSRAAPALASHDCPADRRVIYVGTFSKVLFPALRLAYLIAPPDLVPPVVCARAWVDYHAPLFPQMALADFIAGGRLAVHIRRMRTLYRARRQALLDAIATLSDRLRVTEASAGLHATAALTEEPDTDVCARAAEAGLSLLPLSSCYLDAPRSGLILGFAAFDELSIQRGVECLDDVLRRR